MHANNPRTAIQENDVIVSTVGTIGNCAVATKSILPANSSRSVGIIRLNLNKYSPFVLSTFLVSKYGRVQTLRESTGNVQLCLFIHKLKELKIPQFSQDFQLEIQKLVQDSHKALEDSKRLYKEAQELLYKELELDFKNPLESLLKSSLQAKKPSELANINDISKKYPHLNISVRSLSKSLHKSGRLDSEYYQSKYDAIERKIKDYQGGWGYVKTMFSRNNTTCNFLKDKYKYIEIGDINTSNGMASFNEIPTNELPANAKIMIEKNDILISKVRPYRGAVAIIDFDIKDTIASGAFVVLRENGDFKKEVLQVLLRTTIYKEWLLKWNVGTSYPVIKDENILDLPIPKINPATQEQIALKIQKSFTLRTKSKDLLQNAKMRLENAIENG